MLNNNYLKDLLSHMEWADSIIWQTIANNQKAFDDERIIKLVTHIYVVQSAFLGLWNKEELTYNEFYKLNNLKSVKEAKIKYHEKLSEFIKNLDQMDLSEKIQIPWKVKYEEMIKGKVEDANLMETIIQTVMHSHYHRAQINARLRELNIEPPMIDYICWVWGERPDKESEDIEL